MTTHSSKKNLVPLFLLNSDHIYLSKPDYIIILAWNYSNHIIKIHNKFLNSGGKFIVPFPKIKIISKKWKTLL